jgi:hypothetical protein
VNEARASTLITVDELAQLIAAQAVVLLDVIDEQGAAPEGRPKIPAPCPLIWRRIFPVPRRRHPGGGHCRTCPSCKLRRAPGESATTVPSWSTTILVAPRRHARGGHCGGPGYRMCACWMADMARGPQPTGLRPIMSPPALSARATWC